jgi:L-alanine-DL-glutamate epimerase-like enolase superfamily enzyme
MVLIKKIETGFYRIPLSVTLTDSTHGEMKAFELITIRPRDSEGAEGVGYTHTVGRNGGAVAHILRRDIPELIEDEEADDTEATWQRIWWALHYGGRGGPSVLALSALDIALWDLKARRANLPLWRLLGGFDRNVPCYAGGIDLDLSIEDLLKQTDDNLGKRLSCHQDEGRPQGFGIRCSPCKGHARSSRRGLSADGRRQYEVDGRRKRSEPPKRSRPLT